MNIKRKIDSILAESRGTQLLLILALIAFVFAVFYGLSKIFFGAGAFSWQDIIALFLDPGVFGGVGEHDWFRLLITLFGVLCVAALLISVVSNIFENISDHYRKGEARYRFKNHILILGSGNIIYGLLKFISESKDSEFVNKKIVVMTYQPVEQLRNSVEAYLDNKKFLKHITFYYDKRDNKKNLERADAGKASKIYIIGEDNETNHDLINLRCLELLREITKENCEKKDCFVVMNSQTTMRAYQKMDNSASPEGAKLNEHIININECNAEKILENTVVKEIKKNPESKNPINIVIFGMTALGRALATTVSYAFHFENKRKTIITIIDEDIKGKAQDFIDRYNVFFHYCDYSFGIKPDQQTQISWNFVSLRPSSKDVIDFIKDTAENSELYVYVCYDEVEKNIATELYICNKLIGLNIYTDRKGYGDADKIIKNLYSPTQNLHDDENIQYIFVDRPKPEVDPKRQEDDSHFIDKQKNIYKNVAKNFWEAQDSCIFKEYVNFLLGVPKSGESYQFLAYDTQDYFPIISGRCWDGNKFGENYGQYEYLKYSAYRFKGLKDESEKTCKKILRFYIEALNEGKKTDITLFLEYGIWRLTNRDSVVITKELMCAVKEYVEKNEISFSEAQELTDTLSWFFHPTRYDIFVRIDEDSEDEPFRFPDDILTTSLDILKAMANAGKRYSSYASMKLSFLYIDDEQWEDSLFWFKKAIEDSNNNIPIEYFKRITGSGESKEKSLSKVEFLYDETKFDACLDWLILQILPELDKDNFIQLTEHGKSGETSFIEQAESFVRAKCQIDNDIELFLRLSEPQGLKPSYKGMWLSKAATTAKQNNDDEAYVDACSRLGDYHLLMVHIPDIDVCDLYESFSPSDESEIESAAGFYKEAYNCAKEPLNGVVKNKKLAELNYGMCCYWGLGDEIKQDKALALSLGYNYNESDKDERAEKLHEIVMVLDDEWFRGEEIEREMEVWKRDCQGEETRWSHEDFDRKLALEKEKRRQDLQRKINEWEKAFPNIPHPYGGITVENES